MIARALVLLTLLTLLGLPTWGRSAVNHAPIRATSLWAWSSDSAIQTTAQTRYTLPMAPETGDYSATESAREGVCPITVTIDQLVVVLSADIGDAGDNLTVTLRKNGAGTALVCTITGAGGTEVICEDLDAAHAITCAAGDRVSVELVTAATPAAVTASGAMRARTARANRSIWLANQPGASTSADRFFPAQGAVTVAATADTGRVALPAAGALVGIAVHSDSTYTSTQTRTITAMVDGSADTAVQCVLDAAGVNACLDTSGPIALVRGTTVSLRNSPANTPPADGLGVGIAFAPARSGTFIFMSGSSGGPLTSGTQYAEIARGLGTWAASEVATKSVTRALTLIGFYASVATAAGIGSDWNFYVRRVDTSTDTVANIVISGSSELADFWEGSVGVPDLSTLNYKIVPNIVPPASPGATRISMSATMPR